MRIWILSDLHLELDPWAPPEGVVADVLVLAGDIHRGTRAIKWMKTFREALPDNIIYVAGNHEHYREILPRALRELRAARLLGLHFLENSSVVIAGVRFLGATLWSDCQILGDKTATLRCARYMNDYRAIRTSSSTELSPTDTCKWHEISRAWLARNLDEPFDGPTVVVTHHAPSLRSISAEYKEDPGTGFFASNLESLLDARATLWIHGHTHASCDYTHCGTRVVANPAGYLRPSGVRENLDFAPRLVVELT